MANKFLQYLVVSFLIFSILQSSYLLYKVDQTLPEIDPGAKSTAGASGVINMCINTPPSIVIPCNTTAEQGTPYTCQLNATDPNSGTNFTFSSNFITNNTLFNASSSGLINFTPTNNDTGNHSVTFFVFDDSGCTNNQDSDIFNLTVDNINDAPFLEFTIPNVTLEENETVRAFFLDNHFTDPDGDNLTYTVSGANESNVTINPNTSEVVIKSDTCDFNDLVIFTAKDPFNLTADSNPVVITCETTQNQQQQTTPSGGGGGGGGGVFLCASPDYDCLKHIPCREDNTKVQRCVDLNGCEEEELITLECNYEQEKRASCQEDWLCSDWGECTINETQSRECLDKNACDTEVDKPAEVQECTYIPTCTDGVKNGNETGVDCGGDCPACRTIESPTPITEQKNWITNLLIILLAALLAVILTYRYEHKRIYMWLSNLGLHFAGRVPKQVLLEDEDRDDLLEKLRKLEERYGIDSLNDLTREYLDIAKSYFFHAMDMQVDMGKEDLLAKIEEGKLNEHLQRVLASFFDKVVNIEFSSGINSGYEIMYLVEELREMILQTADYDNNMVEAKITEYKIADSLYEMEKAYLMLVNAYIPMHFNELDASVKKYMQILEFYESLEEHQKDNLYPDVARLYQKLRYRTAWIENID